MTPTLFEMHICDDNALMRHLMDLIDGPEGATTRVTIRLNSSLGDVAAGK